MIGGMLRRRFCLCLHIAALFIRQTCLTLCQGEARPLPGIADQSDIELGVGKTLRRIAVILLACGILRGPLEGRTIHLRRHETGTGLGRRVGCQRLV